MRPDRDAPIASLRTLAIAAVWLACTLAGGPVEARQVAAPAPPPARATQTGDAWIDLRLADMDAYARRYPQSFVDELVRYFDAPRTLVTERLAARTAPGEVYYACALARIAGRPCRSVLDAWDESPADGWIGLASRLGVAPGSPEAKRLRQAFEDSYRHWARPQPAPAGTTARPRR